MTITIGWWLIPLIVTIICFVLAAIYGKSQGAYDFVFIIYWLAAAIVSLTAWLVWSLM